jgi:uncharacterized protein
MSPLRSAPATRESVVRRHPVRVFLVIAFVIGWPILGTALIAGVPIVPVPLLAAMVVALLVPALVVTRRTDGPGAVRRLFARTLLWRFGWWWAVVLFGMPALALAFAAVSGTVVNPRDGWLAVLGLYLFMTLIFGALILNLWEELVWGGFVQSRLIAGRGLLAASLITAAFFAAFHVPLAFEGERSWSQVGSSLLVLFGVAPVFRYLIGMVLLETGGSVLAVAVLHASFNATQSLDVVDGGTWEWQLLASVAVLTALVAARRSRASRYRGQGPDAETSAAAAWVGAPDAHIPPRPVPSDAL